MRAAFSTGLTWPWNGGKSQGCDMGSFPRCGVAPRASPGSVWVLRHSLQFFLGALCLALEASSPVLHWAAALRDPPSEILPPCAPWSPSLSPQLKEPGLGSPPWAVTCDRRVHLICFLFLRDHRLLSEVQCLKNHGFIGFVRFLVVAGRRVNLVPVILG